MFPRNSSNYFQSCQPQFISVSALLSKPESLKYTDEEVIEQLKKIQLDVVQRQPLVDLASLAVVNEPCGKACEDKGITNTETPIITSNIYFSS